MAKSIFALNRPLTLDELVVRRRGLVRLGLAWLAMMQVGMFALPGYLDIKVGPDDSAEVYHWAIFLMNWASFVMTVPVVLYSAWPVWTGFVLALQERRVTMDVPVAVSIVAAFVPSAVATITGHGEVYFDPFHRGRILSRVDVECILFRQGLELKDCHLQASSPRQILVRMLANLLYVYDLQGECQKHERVRGWMQALKCGLE